MAIGWFSYRHKGDELVGTPLKVIQLKFRYYLKKIVIDRIIATVCG